MKRQTDKKDRNTGDRNTAKKNRLKNIFVPFVAAVLILTGLIGMLPLMKYDASAPGTYAGIAAKVPSSDDIDLDLTGGKPTFVFWIDNKQYVCNSVYESGAPDPEYTEREICYNSSDPRECRTKSDIKTAFILNLLFITTGLIDEGIFLYACLSVRKKQDEKETASKSVKE